MNLQKKITITHPELNLGNPVRVVATGYTIGGKRNVNADPEENSDDLVEVQDLSIENFIIKISGIREENITERTLTYEDVVLLYRQRHVPGNEIFLSIEDKGKEITGSKGQYPVKVVFKAFDLNSDAKDTDKFIWNMRFMESE